MVGMKATHLGIERGGEVIDPPLYCSHYKGSFTVKVVPPPSVLSTSTEPPIASM
jgi:hypothetical protein